MSLKNFIKKHSSLAKSIFYTYIIKPYISVCGKKDRRRLKHRISLCLIFKNEAPFLEEWIDFHRTIGVDHFYLYNNESSDNFLSVIGKYIEEGLVTLIDFPGKGIQMEAYKHCFETFGNETNWIGYFDTDEFICPLIDMDINDWINKFAKFPSVLIYNQVFGTSGIIDHDFNKNVIEQYFSCWPQIQNFGKCFVNTRFKISNYSTPFLHHSTSTYFNFFGVKLSLPPINQFGDICPCMYVLGGVDGKKEKADIHLNHYFTKSWNIYKKRIEKGGVFSVNNPRKSINYFYFHECRCTSRNHAILRFIIKMKLLQGKISK